MVVLQIGEADVVASMLICVIGLFRRKAMDGRELVVLRVGAVESPVAMVGRGAVASMLVFSMWLMRREMMGWARGLWGQACFEWWCRRD